ncbi:type IV toxin-antitoxin system AbiEi family antitoxin domain-containing protein [Desertivibrio insolitus]|uniref:type IV toxin-antitoxin system AbiEi family antitoxin domain-containing protein n=1 Tax=Herbiconiux sp. SYSU D00978 TaxID=2812562 RepID=UPI001A9706FB|nr:type IV toxin-antitoxin system AbiEi family antitoxin domain-containing protein [Herbiconiux sp. SYSU D00978]
MAADCVLPCDAGLISTERLARLGWTRHRMTRAVALGRLTRVRRGLYRCPHATSRVRAAAEAGARLTGLAALAELGCWMWREPTLSVAVPFSGTRTLRRPATARVHWCGQREMRRASLASVHLLDALRHTALDEEHEDAVAAFDWAFCSGRLTLAQFEEVLARLPQRLQSLREAIDPRCESFLESVARTRLRSAGHALQTQVPIGPDWLLRRRQRVDLVVDAVVALELDGREHHEQSFEADRRKDLDAAIAGLVPLRVSYSMVEREWWLVEKAIAAARTRPAGGTHE